MCRGLGRTGRCEGKDEAVRAGSGGARSLKGGEVVPEGLGTERD